IVSWKEKPILSPFNNRRGLAHVSVSACTSLSVPMISSICLTIMFKNLLCIIICINDARVLKSSASKDMLYLLTIKVKELTYYTIRFVFLRRLEYKFISL